MPHMRAPLAAVLGVVVFPACASTSALEEEMSRLRRELVSMRKELQETQVAVQKLESRVTLSSLGEGVSRPPTTEVATTAGSVAKGNESKRAETKATSTPKSKPAEQRVLPVVRLGSKAEAQTESETWMDPGALDDGSPPIVIKLEGDNADDRLAIDHDVLKKPDPVLGGGAKSAKQAPAAKVSAKEATSAEIEADYGAALARLRADGKPEEALALFKKFRTDHPRSNLADNAIYWMGECQFAMRDFEKAIVLFEELARDYPRSSKVPDALLRSGESWSELARPEKARRAYQQIIDAHPKSEAAKTAEKRISALATGTGR
jgi:tol-pal system protein YbgF